MFNIDPSIILLGFVVCPVIALVCFLNLTSSNYDTLPYRSWLMELPGYAFLYQRSDGASDIPDRNIKTVLIWLAALYLSVLALAVPFVNKLLGMFSWLVVQSAHEIVLVLFFDVCIVAVCYLFFNFLKDIRTASRKRYRFLPLVLLGLLLGASDAYAMSADARLVVLLACKTTLLGLFGFFFFGAFLFAANETEAESAAGEVGSRLLNVFLIVLTMGSLISIVV